MRNGPWTPLLSPLRAQCTHYETTSGMVYVMKWKSIAVILILNVYQTFLFFVPFVFIIHFAIVYLVLVQIFVQSWSLFFQLVHSCLFRFVSFSPPQTNILDFCVVSTLCDRFMLIALHRIEKINWPKPYLIRMKFMRKIIIHLMCHPLRWQSILWTDDIS